MLHGTYSISRILSLATAILQGARAIGCVGCRVHYNDYPNKRNCGFFQAE